MEATWLPAETGRVRTLPEPSRRRRGERAGGPVLRKATVRPSRHGRRCRAAARFRRDRASRRVPARAKCCRYWGSAVAGAAHGRGFHLATGDLGWVVLAGAGVGCALWTVATRPPRRMSPRVVGVPGSPEAAVAGLAGAVVLGEQLSFAAWCGIGYVIVADAVQSRRDVIPVTTKRRQYVSGRSIGRTHGQPRLRTTWPTTWG